MSNIQRCFVDRKSSIDKLKNNKFENNYENLFDEIINNKCDDKIITHVFSQLKKNMLLMRFFVMMFRFSMKIIFDSYVIE
jgi:hypothetical protein